MGVMLSLFSFFAFYEWMADKKEARKLKEVGTSASCGIVCKLLHELLS